MTSMKSLSALQDAPSLLPFWRRTRKAFVPLSAEECERVGLLPERLCRLGLIEKDDKGGIATYHLSKRGEGLCAYQIAQAAGGKK